MSVQPTRSFSTATVAWIVGLVLGSFALALVLSAFADDLGEPDSAGSDSFSYGALGHRAFVELLERNGFTVERRRTERPGPLAPTTPLVVAEPPPERVSGEGGGDRMTRLHDMAWAADAPLVLVLPKRDGVPDAYRPGWVGQTDLLGYPAIQSAVAPLAGQYDLELDLERDMGLGQVVCEAVWGRSYRIDLRQRQTIVPDNSLEQLVTCDGATLIAGLREQGVCDDGCPGLYIVSDPDLLANHGIANGDNAELVRDLLREHLQAESIVLDETIHGFGRRTGILAGLFRFPLVLALTHGVALIGLVVWAGTGRFGRPQPTDPALGSGKQVLIDNTAKLIGVSGQTARSLPGYFRQTMRDVGARYFLPVDMAPDRMLMRLQEISTSRGLDDDLQQLRRAVGRLLVGRGRQAERAVKLARELHRWRVRMTHDD